MPHVDRKLRWFDEGAPLLRPVLNRLGVGHLLPVDEEYYACPCCLEAYNRAAVIAGLLTEEHVPPGSLGGRGLLLTCARCNSNAGRFFDAHAGRRKDAEDFASGRVTGRTMPATFHANGIPLRGTAQWTEDGIQFFGVPRQNNPEVQAAYFRTLDEYVETGDSNPNVSFTVHANYDVTRARYSWIRSAYLVAFSALGWSYIFRPIMEPITDQLRNPDTARLRSYMFRDPTAEPSERRILLVDEPDELRCVAVKFGQHVAFLPGLARPLTWEQLAEAFGRRRRPEDRLSGTLDGKDVPWPRWPTYLLDKPQS